MADDTLSSEFYWNTIVIKVEDRLFCVPLCEFVQSSEVFADMFLLPSGPTTHREGQDKEHPIVLEGYKKDEFASLLRVMYPTAGSLISNEKIELRLEKEEWVSVLKLSTIWDMKKIRQYAIHRLSTDVTLSPTEKFLVGRAHRVPAWLKEGITTLTSNDYKPTLEDLATLGWETAARILWIRENSRHFTPNTLCFSRDSIKCGNCTSSLINTSYGCGHIGSADSELTFPGPGSLTGAGTASRDRLVMLNSIQCKICGRTPFYIDRILCSSCSSYTARYHNVRITPMKGSEEMIEEMFGEEIKDHETATTIT